MSNWSTVRKDTCGAIGYGGEKRNLYLEYSPMSGSLILDRFDVWKEGKQEASYERDINDYWYVRDASGNKTACDRPEAADCCPPRPVR